MQPLAPFSAGYLFPRGFRPEDSAGRRHFATGACGKTQPSTRIEGKVASHRLCAPTLSLEHPWHLPQR